MYKLDWKEIAEATGSTILDPGAYIITITNVEDDEKYERLLIEYDIAEGPKKGIYSLMGPDEGWKHRFTQKYSKKAQPFFKGFLKELEADNPSFTIDKWQVNSNVDDFVGLNLGMIFRPYYYINDKGDAKRRLDGFRPIRIQDVRDGNWEAPEPSFQSGTDASYYTDIMGSYRPAHKTDDTDIYTDSIPF